MTPLSIVVWFNRAFKDIGLQGCSGPVGRRCGASAVVNGPGSIKSSKQARGASSPQSANEVDELAVVGHSTGGVIASAIVARALELDRDLGRSGVFSLLAKASAIVPLSRPRATKAKTSCSLLVRPDWRSEPGMPPALLTKARNS